jgi:hypothetical protein
MQLQPLAARDAKSAVAKLITHIEFCQQIVGRQLAAGNPRPHHHHVGLTRLRAVVSRATSVVAIVLLVCSVVLQEPDISAAETFDRRIKLVGDAATELPAAGFFNFNFADFGVFGHRVRLLRLSRGLLAANLREQGS